MSSNADSKNATPGSAPASNKPDHGDLFIPGSETAPQGLAPQPLDHFKRGYKERAELRDREMEHLQQDFDHQGGSSRDKAVNHSYSGTDRYPSGSDREHQRYDRSPARDNNNSHRGERERNDSFDRDRDREHHYQATSNNKRHMVGPSEFVPSAKRLRDRPDSGSYRDQDRDRDRDRDRDYHSHRNHSSSTFSVGFEVSELVNRLCSPRCHVPTELESARRNSPSSFDTGKAITAILSALARRKDMKVALAVWNWMDAAGIRRNVFHYNALISVCEKTKDYRRSMQLLVQMEREGCKKNEVTFSSAISTCEKTGQWQKAIELLEQMKKEGIPQTAIAYNAAISACEKGLNPLKAMEVFQVMKRSGVTPTVVTYSALIR